jgi:hypothetical protein
MDAIVEAALKKWPNVPDCRGWLALDARGNWYMRDDRVQRAGPFPAVKGSRIEHPRLIDFIHRNYAADPGGCWFFQNGPQRVYVELEAAPWVWRLRASGASGAQPAVWSHTGLQPTRIDSAWLDEQGRLFLSTDLGLGLVHTQDMVDAADAIEAGLWQPVAIASADLPARFGFVVSPLALAESARAG